MLKDPKSRMLDARLGSRDTNSNIIDISITTEDAELSADIVQAIVAGYENHINEKATTYSKEAKDVLTKFSEEYGKTKAKAKAELDKLRLNSDILWKEGKPIDPATEKITKINELILEIDRKMKNTSSVIQQIDLGREAKRPIEDLLRMAIISSNSESSNKMAGDSFDLNREKDIARGLLQSIELFESERVIPLRAELSRLKEMALGDSHPSVTAAKGRIDMYEEELARRKQDLKRAEEGLNVDAYGKPEIVTKESKLKVAYGALTETLSALQWERNQFKQEADAVKPKMLENQALISNYLFNLADLEAVKEVAEQSNENLRKLNVGSEFGVKSITKLDIPALGKFAGPFWYQFLGIGAMLGVIAFCGIAYLLEMADRSYRNPDEIAGDLGMPIIGHLPLATLSRADRVDEKVDSSIVTLHKNRSSLAEAFRGIRTAVFFGCQQGNIKVIQVTSPVPGDGKSTVAANMAVSIAQSGRKVCIIDCDFRRPRVAKIFGLKEDVGLVQVIGGKVELEDAIQQTTIENLFSVTCGRRPGNPSELLSSEMFADALAALKAKFDFVIVDTPPILVVSDPANVASLVDAVLLTVRLRRNLKPIATRAAQMLHSINANMLGVIVNGIGVGGNGYGYGGYRYDNYSGGSSGGYGKSGYGGYGYGSTYQYGGYYGGTMIGRDYYDDQVPKPVSKKNKVNS